MVRLKYIPIAVFAVGDFTLNSSPNAVASLIKNARLSVAVVSPNPRSTASLLALRTQASPPKSTPKFELQLPWKRQLRRIGYGGPVWRNAVVRLGVR